MARRWPRALLALSVVAAFAVVPVAPTSARSAQTIAVTGITCATTTTIVVPSAVAKDDNVTLAFSGTGCSGFDVDKFNNFTGMSGDNPNGKVNGSNTITLSQRKQYSALSSPKTTLATISNGSITVTIENTAEVATSSFTSDSPPNGTVSSAYTYTFAATGSPNFYEVASGSLPAGLSLDSTTGVLSGTPTTATSYTFTIQVTNLVSDAVVTGSSNTVTISAAATSPPNSPATVVATAGDGQATVNVIGSGSGDPATQFNVTGTPGGNCTISTVTGSPPTGSCTITALANGTSYIFSATAQNSAGTNLTGTSATAVTPLGTQTITYTQPANQMFSSGSLTVAPTTNATGNTVTLTSSTTGVCTVAGFTISFVTTGTCTTTAAAGSTSTYSAATNVTRSFSITSNTAQTITYTGASTTPLSAGSVAVTASASSGLAVTMTSTTPGVCTVSGSSPNFTLSLVSAGTCTTTASQAGDSTYAAATDVTRSFTITSSGGGGGVTPATASPSPTTTRKVTLCHRTSSYTNPYVEITVDQNSVLSQGHGSHTGGVFPAAGWGDIIPPFDGYAGLNWTPEGQTILASDCDATKARGKVTLCHATASRTNPYVLITVDKNAILKKGHGSHTGGLYPTKGWGDIIPPFDDYPGLNWPGGQQYLDWGCSTSAPTVLTSEIDKEPIPEQPICLAQPGETSTTPLTREDVKLEPGPKANEVEIVSSTGEPLTLLNMEVSESTGGTQLEVVSSGADLNKPSVWQGLGYGDFCWKLEPFSDTDYQYTLPNPISVPSGARGSDWTYSNVIVKAGSITTTDPNYQANTIFGGPQPGDIVWADVNRNGVFDPGGRGKDKSISHIIICAKSGSSASPTPTRSATPMPSPTVTTATNTCGIPESSPSPSPSASTTTSSPTPSASGTSASPSPTGSTNSTSPSPSPSVTRATASPTPSPTTSTSNPSPSATRTPSVAPSESPTPPPPIIIRVREEETPSPTPSPLLSGSGSSSPSPSASRSPSPSAASATPTPTPTTSTSSPTASGSTTPASSTSPSPSGSTSVTPGSSSSPSSSGSPTTSTPAPTSTPGPSGSTTSASPSPTSTGAGPDGSASPSTPSGTSGPDSTPSPGSPGGPTSGTDPSAEEPVSPQTRDGFVKFKVAQGDSTLTFVVPMTRMKALAAQAGEPTLADTGSSRTVTVTAAVVFLAAGLMLLPAIRRRRG